MLRIPRDVSSSWALMSLRKLAMCAESIGGRSTRWGRFDRSSIARLAHLGLYKIGHSWKRNHTTVGLLLGALSWLQDTKDRSVQYYTDFSRQESQRSFPAGSSRKSSGSPAGQRE